MKKAKTIFDHELLKDALVGDTDELMAMLKVGESKILYHEDACFYEIKKLGNFYEVPNLKKEE